MAIPSSLVHETQDTELYQVSSILATTKNLNVEFIKGKLSSVKYLMPWVVFYRGRTVAPLDIFAEGLSHYSQIKGRSQKNFEEAFKILKELTGKEQYAVDLNNEADVKIIKKCFDICGKEEAEDEDEEEEEEDDDNKATAKASTGTKIVVSIEGFNIMNLRKKILELKVGPNTKNIEMKFTQTPHTVDGSMANLQLSDKVLKLQGQSLYTVGDYFLHDLWLPKTKCISGAQFSLAHFDGAVHGLDVAMLDEMMLRFPANEPQPLLAGNVLNLSSALVYGVNEFGAKIKLRFIRMLKASTGKQAEFKGEDIEADIGD